MLYFRVAQFPWHLITVLFPFPPQSGFTFANMLVAINFGSFDELQTIPGIGPKLADLILSVRDSSGNITPEVLERLARGRLDKSALADIDFAFNGAFEELDEELDSSFAMLTSTVKREPSLGGSKIVGATASGMSAAPLTPEAEGFTPEMGPKEGIASVHQLEDVVELLRKAREMIKPNPGMHTGIDELDLPPLPDVPHPPSTILSSRPRLPQGATTPAPACRPKVPLPESKPTASLSLAEATERQLTFDDGLVAPVNSSAANGEGQLEVGGLVSKPDPVAVEKHRKHTTDVMKSLPKGLTFDGKSNWFAFKHKFTLYATELGWTSADCLHCAGV